MKNNELKKLKKVKLINRNFEDEIIERKQYANLRECFNNILLKPILGDDYYNMAMDVYQCDLECCKDIKRRYDFLKYDMKMWRRIAIILFIISILLLLK